MDFDREQSAGYLTNWAARFFARNIDRRLRAIGVSSGQLPVFFALAGGKAQTQKALAAAAAIEQPTMASTLTRMERDGLILRRADPADGRQMLVELTPDGRARLGAVHEAIMAVNAEALEGLDEAERSAFLAALRRIVSNLDAALSANGQSGAP